MSTDEQAKMVGDISSIIMRGRYGRSGVGHASDNPLDLRDARRIVEYITARDEHVRRDAARSALDGFKAWRGTAQCPATSPPDPCNRPVGHAEPHAYYVPQGETNWNEFDWENSDTYRDIHYPEEE